mmetsp:Transcript_19306/g.23504  ORF Transcript_19306/g.23504 Transcript_19306/m.23504 type:complete len:115 (-) Transcript_19306:429-773(-)
MNNLELHCSQKKLHSRGNIFSDLKATKVKFLRFDATLSLFIAAANMYIHYNRILSNHFLTIVAKRIAANPLRAKNAIPFACIACSCENISATVPAPRAPNSIPISPAVRKSASA